ncbi:Tetratricopeptide repeat-containing protein [Halpernia humi]|uniref:Tetratricopeptide repeat-containing protein n=1 Tax=Halpernia humi TaxID=493375 RepID=A0A1H5ZN79_9FLAO|nr:tetratricopeptide repeat protein [Halpernia humi]SEG38013.1 Tetratricopeptide repeat-containing protein [Halpernia humi]
MKKILLLFFLIQTATVFSQKQATDSLTKVFENATTPLEKAKLLVKRSKSYPAIEINAPKKDALDALAFAEKANDSQLQVDILNQLSGIYSRDNQYEEANKLDEKALALSIKNNYALGKIRTYKNMGRNLKTMGRVEEAIQKTILAKKIAVNEHFPQELANVNNALGILYRVNGQFSKSLEVLDEALGQVGKNKNLEALIHMNKGNTLSELVRLEDAAKSYFAGLKINESLNNTKGILQSYNNLSVLFKKANQYDKAITYAKKSLALASRYNNKYSMGIAYDNLATLYDLTAKKDSIVWYRKGTIKLFEAIKDENNIARTYHNLGEFYLLQNNFVEAKKYLTIALEKRLKLKNKLDIASTQTNLGILADKEKNYALAEDYLLKAKKNTENEKTENNKFLLNALSEHYKLKGDLKNALEEKEAEVALQDSLLQSSEIVKVMNTAHDYEMKKKDSQINAAESFKSKYNHNRIFFAIALFIVFIIAMYSFIRWKKVDQKKKQLQLEKQSIEAKHDEISETLEEVKKKASLAHIELKNKTKVYLQDLLYMRSDDHYVELVRSQKVEQVRTSLKEIAEQLPPNFVRCHKSYIVNKNFIKQSNLKEFIMTNNAIVPKSRSYKNE